MVHRFRLCCLATMLGCVLVPSLVNAQATFSMKAVRVNPVCVGGINAGEHCTSDFICDSNVCGGAITPTNVLRAQPGDVIVAEVYISNFSPNGESLKAWQIDLDEERMIYSGCESVFPLGVERCPVDAVTCSTNFDCSSSDRCTLFSCCVPLETIQKGILLDSTRTDYVFFGLNALSGINPVNYKMGATLLSTDVAVTFDGTPKYAGTLVVVVAADACGTSIVAFVENVTSLLSSSSQFIEISTYDNLTIEVATPCLQEILSDIINVQPPSCTLFPNFIHNNLTLTLAQVPKIDLSRCRPTVRLVTNHPDDPEIEDFGFVKPRILDVSLQGNDLIISLTPTTLYPFAWTCISGFGYADEWCQGLLPGDMNRDLTANEIDVLSMMDCLRTPEFCEMDVCDFNLSGACTPLDMLDLIDVLNNPSPPFMNETIVPCPSP